VWSAQGAWEPEEAQRVCEELGLVRAFDPLETKASAAPVVYATLRALGHRAGFSLAALADALTKTIERGPEEAFISVDAERAFDTARRLRTLAAEAGADTALGGAAADHADDDSDEEEDGEPGDEDFDDADDADDEASEEDEKDAS
jgi:hypothetical protein